MTRAELGNTSNLTAEKDMSIQETREQRDGISGKVFVLPFIVVLVFLVYLMFAVAVRFQTIMARLEEVRSLWPNASKELVPRYERLSGIVANASVSESVKKEWEADWQEFGMSSQFDRQSVASWQIESLLKMAAIDLSNDGGANSGSDFSSPGVSKLIEAESRRKSAQNGAIGWLTVQGLRLKLPPIYEPLAKNP